MDKPAFRLIFFRFLTHCVWAYVVYELGMSVSAVLLSSRMIQ